MLSEAPLRHVKDRHLRETPQTMLQLDRRCPRKGTYTMNERNWVEMHEALLLIPANVVTRLTRPSALGCQEAVVAFGIREQIDFMSRVQLRCRSRLHLTQQASSGIHKNSFRKLTPPNSESKHLAQEN